MVLWSYLFVLALISGLVFYSLVVLPRVSDDSNARKILLSVSILIPVAALIFYQQRGASDELRLLDAMQAMNQGQSVSEQELQAKVADIQQQLESLTSSKPENPGYWFLLGDLNMQTQSYSDAVVAYTEAAKIYTEDLSIRSRLAEAQFMADGMQLTEAVRGHIDHVLAKKPMDHTVLDILGISAYRAGQFEAAIRFWERALQSLPPMSPGAQSIRSRIDQIRSIAGLETEPESGSESGLLPGTDETLFIEVEVSLADAIEAKPGDSVFVFARQYSEAGSGGTPPLLVERISAGQLPMRLRLDDSKMMIPGRKLADFPQIELVARLSYSGQPTAQKGDYQIVHGPIDVAQLEDLISLQISEKVD